MVDQSGTIYVGSDDGCLYAVTADGARKWCYPTGGPIRSAPAIGADGTIYVGSDDGFLYALSDADTEGLLKWQFATAGPVRSSPTVDAGGVIYVGSDDGFLYAVLDDGTDGLLQWEFETFGAVRSSPAVGADGSVYAGSFDGLLYAVGADGQALWSVPLAENLGSPVIAQDGTLYIGSGETAGSGAFLAGQFLAVETASTGISSEAPWPMFHHDVRHTGRNTPNEAPQAVIGGEQTVTSGQTVTLDGSASTDPDYGIAAYTWRQTAGPSVTMTGENDVQMSFVAPDSTTTTDSGTTTDGNAAEPLTFELTVTDNGGLESTDTASVTVEEKDEGFCFIGAIFQGFLPYLH